MPIVYPIKAYTQQQLEQDARPGNATQPESIPWTWFDSQNFATNFGTVTFFAAPQTDPTLGNIEQANTFSADQWFRLFAVTLDWLIGASSRSSGAPAIVDDLLAIQNTARAIWNLKLSQKQYANVPIHALHASGGIYVNYQLGTPTASGVDNYAMNWMPDGGYNYGGALVFGPRQTFSSTIFGTTVTLNATRMGRMTFHGVLSRRVL
jgi:hypothetical protein